MAKDEKATDPKGDVKGADQPPKAGGDPLASLFDKKGDPAPQAPTNPPAPHPAPQPQPVPRPVPPLHANVQPVTGPVAIDPSKQQVVVQLVNPIVHPPDPIPGFDETVDGGHYIDARGRHVDAHGVVIPDGRKKQTREVRQKQLAAIDDISKTPWEGSEVGNVGEND